MKTQQIEIGFEALSQMTVGDVLKLEQQKMEASLE